MNNRHVPKIIKETDLGKSTLIDIDFFIPMPPGVKPPKPDPQPGANPSSSPSPKA